MAIWYVDDAGSNANDGKTAGNPKKYLWLDDGNSALFNEALDADRPAAGDIVFVLENHSEDYGAVAKILTDNAKGTESAPIKVVTVDSLSSPTAYGAKKNSLLKTTVGSGWDLILRGIFFIQGFEFHGGDTFQCDQAADIISFKDCELSGNRGATYGISLNAQGTAFRLYNTDIKAGADYYHLFAQKQGLFIMEGGAVLVSLDGVAAHGEYGRAEFRGVDFSVCTDSVVGTVGGERGGLMVFERCKLPATPTFVNGTPNSTMRYIFDHCHDGDDYFEFREETRQGTITYDGSNARTATYDGTTKYSTLLASNTNVSGGLGGALRAKLVELQGIDLTSETTLTVELSQYNAGGAPTALTEHEFTVAVESVDSTDLAFGKWSRSNSDTGFWDTSPGNLTTSTETWTQVSNITKQKVSITLSAVTGADNVSLAVWVNLSKASADVNVCPEVDIS